MNIQDLNLANNYSDIPVELGKGIFWVGYYDEAEGLHCNPYLIVEGDEAVLLDGGSRTDFSTVMLKILQTGIDPKNINRLIYHHYDPDLCGSIIHLEDVIDSSNLKIISHNENNVFIKYYAPASPRVCISDLNYEYTFRSGRTLKFIRTPYSHSAGSFVTYDESTKTLFSSDIFGSLGKNWSLIIEIKPECKICDVKEKCSIDGKECNLHGMKNFHRRIMTSSIALKYAMKQIEKLDIELIAPQHGSIIYKKEDIEFLRKLLANLESVGIDNYK